MKILTFTDVHLCDKNPSSRKDDYFESIFNKLEQIKYICEDMKVSLCLCAGDLFHIRAPVKTSHYLLSKVISLFKSFPCPIYTIIGNHDLRFDNMSTVSRQPINLILKSDACKLLTDVKIDNVRIFCVDYMNDPSYIDFNREKISNEIQICVSHVTASSKFSEFFGERVYRYQELKDCSPDIFLFGHHHEDQGIEQINNKYFINIGSISRGSLKKDSLNRIPSVGIIEIENNFINCSRIGLNVLSTNEIFDLVQKEKEDKEFDESEKFINELKEKLTTGNENEKMDKILNDVGIDKKIRDLAYNYLNMV